jgi:hypothetical protein
MLTCTSGRVEENLQKRQMELLWLGPDQPSREGERWQSAVLSSRCLEWSGLTRRIGIAGTPNLPAWRFGMEQTSILDSNYCYTVKELAFLWNMSPESIRRMFVNEPGTLVFRMQATGRRTYRNVRIPGKVALRVQNRMTVVAPVTRPAYGR